MIQTGKPTQNAFIASFNGRFRDECLNDHWFTTLAEALILIAAWCRDYNLHRPHSTLDYLIPSEFAAKHRATSTGHSAGKEHFQQNKPTTFTKTQLALYAGENSDSILNQENTQIRFFHLERIKPSILQFLSTRYRLILVKHGGNFG